MTDQDKQHTTIRQKLLALGVRVVAFSFDGSGDEGSVEDYIVPPSFPHKSLNEYVEQDPVFGTFVGKGFYSYEKKAYTPCEQFVATDLLIKSVEGAEVALDEMAYAALEHFPGDWVNNDGGYGTVGLDLLTGEYYIDGNQRYTDSDDASKGGQQWDPVDAFTSTPTLDLSAYIKSKLA